MALTYLLALDPSVIQRVSLRSWLAPGVRKNLRLRLKILTCPMVKVVWHPFNNVECIARTVDYPLRKKSPCDAVLHRDVYGVFDHRSRNKRGSLFFWGELVERLLHSAQVSAALEWRCGP